MKKCLLILSVVLLCGSGLRAMESDGGSGFVDSKPLITIFDLDFVNIDKLQIGALKIFSNSEFSTDREGEGYTVKEIKDILSFVEMLINKHLSEFNLRKKDKREKLRKKS